MRKIGRPLVSTTPMETIIGVRVTGDLADAMFVYASRHRTDVSTLTRRYWESLAQTLNENSESEKHEAVSA